MSKISVITNDQASPEVQTLFAQAKAKMDKVPNLLGVMAHAPQVLGIYLGNSAALATGQLPAPIRERIAIAIASANGCEYCLSAHTLGGKAAGISAEQLAAAQYGHADDAKTQAVLDLALALLKTAGRTSTDLIHQARETGLSDAEILETAAHVSLNILTNTINNMVGTELDFPKVELIANQAA